PGGRSRQRAVLPGPPARDPGRADRRAVARDGLRRPGDQGGPGGAPTAAPLLVSRAARRGLDGAPVVRPAQYARAATGAVRAGGDRADGGVFGRGRGRAEAMNAAWWHERAPDEQADWPDRAPAPPQLETDLPK